MVGALTNDSGPVLFINAVLALAAVSAYLFGRPGTVIATTTADPSSRTTPSQAGRASADPVLQG